MASNPGSGTWWSMFHVKHRQRQPPSAGYASPSGAVSSAPPAGTGPACVAAATACVALRPRWRADSNSPRHISPPCHPQPPTTHDPPVSSTSSSARSPFRANIGHPREAAAAPLRQLVQRCDGSGHNDVHIPPLAAGTALFGPATDHDDVELEIVDDLAQEIGTAQKRLDQATRESGRAERNGMPGRPAPLPTSATAHPDQQSATPRGSAGALPQPRGLAGPRSPRSMPAPARIWAYRSARPSRRQTPRRPPAGAAETSPCFT